METEAGGPVSRSKKRKRAPLESATREREPPATRRELAPIASAMYPTPSFVTSSPCSPPRRALAPRSSRPGGGHIWRSVPLNLDCGDLAAPSNRDCSAEPTKGSDLDRGGYSVYDLDPRRKAAQNSDLDQVVSRILASHQALVRRLCIPTGHGCTKARMEAWLRSSTLDNLEELEFCYVPTKVRHPWLTPLVPPASTFRFAATLRLANFGECQLPDNIVQCLHFPQLKHLMLHWAHISECSIHRLIAGCPAIECLLIYNISGFRCLWINALRLRSISVRTYFHDNWTHQPLFNNLIFENAPCLERLFCLHLFDDIHVSVISAPQLETIGSINNGHPSFTRITKRVRADSLTVACLVKTLVVHRPDPDLNKVIGFMRCFPCLEKLYIQNESTRAEGSRRPKNFWRHKHPNDIV